MELTDKQIERQDFVDNMVYNMLNVLTPSDQRMNWDIETIGLVRDTIANLFVKKGVCTEQEFYPFIEIK